MLAIPRPIPTVDAKPDLALTRANRKRIGHAKRLNQTLQPPIHKSPLDSTLENRDQPANRSKLRPQLAAEIDHRHDRARRQIGAFAADVQLQGAGGQLKEQMPPFADPHRTIWQRCQAFLERSARKHRQHAGIPLRDPERQRMDAVKPRIRKESAAPRPRRTKPADHQRPHMRRGRQDRAAGAPRQGPAGPGRRLARMVTDRASRDRARRSCQPISPSCERTNIAATSF